MYVASINGQDALSIDTPSTIRLVLSYVDDFVCFMAARTEAKPQEWATSTFTEIEDRAKAIGHSFAARKRRFPMRGERLLGRLRRACR
jgi:hypothetical protein